MRRWRKIALLMMALVLCASLCGCVDLDAIRASRATFVKGGAEGIVRLADGTEYKLLPLCEELYPDFDNEEYVYIADEELPLLLTSFSQSAFLKSDDGMFLQLINDEIENFYYCRMDAYDGIADRINNGYTLELCGYWYYDYDTGSSEFCELNEEQNSAIFEVFGTAKPESLPGGMEPEYDDMLDLVTGSKDKLFMRDTIDVCVFNGKYYVVGYDNDTTVLYQAPESMIAVFASMFEKQNGSDFYSNEW